ncbi:hypothetical protein AAWM_02929 [Aspergillus awamori]|uniref:Methyltransferase domain-containing protein n=1 Tax=Aspergillus awamori TaxID=105351 RepID=A0A401KL43_ASPAW|nr:hypothetical protein AAWM_02929 [Aspergillus awamori]
MLTRGRQSCFPELPPDPTPLDSPERSARVTIITAIDQSHPAFHFPGQSMGSFNVPAEDFLPEDDHIICHIGKDCWKYEESSRGGFIQWRSAQHKTTPFPGARTDNTEQGFKVLDIRYGQGESSLVVALINGSHGQITAIDTAPPGYGGPYTIHQSQKHIQASTLEQRIWLLRTDTASLLSHHASTEKFNAAVLCHSLWYFPDRASVAQVFQLLAHTNIHYLCLAEYGFRASRPAQVPHMLAVQTQAWYPSLRKSAATRPREPNVRSALTPDELLDVALQMDGKRNVPATYNLNHSRGTGIVQFVTPQPCKQWKQKEGLSNDASMSLPFGRLSNLSRNCGKRVAPTRETKDDFWAVLELQESAPYSYLGPVANSG